MELRDAGDGIARVSVDSAMNLIARSGELGGKIPPGEPRGPSNQRSLGHALSTAD
jgi:hypothetical protein